MSILIRFCEKCRKKRIACVLTEIGIVKYCTHCTECEHEELKEERHEFQTVYKGLCSPCRELEELYKK